MLRELFDYDNGNLIWKTDRGAQKCKGQVAGTKHTKGYLAIKLKGRVYKAHRLIYIWHHGELSGDMHIDHINGVRDDNRIENLRVATPAENQWNLHWEVNGFTRTRSGRFQVRINVNGKEKHIGMADSEEEAQAMYLQAKEKYHVINS